MTSVEQQNDETEYPCPKCGAMGHMDVDGAVSCPVCGSTPIQISFRPNGDVDFCVKGTGEPYEPYTVVRTALMALEDAKRMKSSPERDLAMVDARAVLVKSYAATGREAMAETMGLEVLGMIRTLAKSGQQGMRARYFEQMSVCATFAMARNDYAEAQRIYSEGIEFAGNVRDEKLASLMLDYGYMCLTRKDLVKARESVNGGLDIVEELLSNGKLEDRYLKATAYDFLSRISGSEGDRDAALEYLAKCVDERRSLVSDDISAVNLTEFADAIVSLAEAKNKAGDDIAASALFDEAVDTTSKYKDRGDAHAIALMGRAAMTQANSEIPETLGGDMDVVISILEPPVGRESRIREMLAQSYMYRSWTHKPDEMDLILKDMEGAYRTLKSLADDGDVNELFLMSAAHSYLVLLGGRDKEKAKAVREELREMGISQSDLDRAARNSLGNASKSRRVAIQRDAPEEPKGKRSAGRGIRKK